MRNFNGFSVSIRPNPDIKSSTIWLVGRLASLFAIIKIAIDSSYEGRFNLFNSIPLIGYNVVDEKDSSMQATIFNANIYRPGIALMGQRIAHNFLTHKLPLYS